MRFCQSFMTALYRYIGPDVDVPAGDIGVGGREIGYLFGQYRRLKGTFENGVLTGKGMSYGGSLIRPEATGFGAVYYLCEVLQHQGDSIEGKTIAISGFGNVAWGICRKARDLGAKVITLSGPDGYIYDPDGVTTDEKDQLSGHHAQLRPGQGPGLCRQVRLPVLPQGKALGREGRYHHALGYTKRRDDALGREDCCQPDQVLHRGGQHAHHQRRPRTSSCSSPA